MAEEFRLGGQQLTIDVQIEDVPLFVGQASEAQHQVAFEIIVVVEDGLVTQPLGLNEIERLLDDAGFASGENGRVD